MPVARRAAAVRLCTAVVVATGVVGATGPAAVAAPTDRVYEQVSPVQKYGSEAGAQSGAGPLYGAATADGDGALFLAGGPVANSPRGIAGPVVARRGANGWTSEAVLADPPDRFVDYRLGMSMLFPSPDLRHVSFSSAGRYMPEQPTVDPMTGYGLVGLYRRDLGGGLSWLTRPTAADATPEVGQSLGSDAPRLLGGSPDQSRVFFQYPGTLVPEDAPRRPQAQDPWNASGLYEFVGGQLRTAATLPDGTVDPDGAQPAGTVELSGYSGSPVTPWQTGNQVSTDGSKLFFVSPDPRNPNGRIPQLYMRGADGTSRLVSRSEVSGTASTSGPVGRLRSSGTGQTNAYAIATPSGDLVFFQSADALTADAPANADAKAYRYDTRTGDLQYLPGAAGTFLAVTNAGDAVVFLAPDGRTLSMWSSSGVREISDIDPAASPGGVLIVEPVKISNDGGAVVFRTSGAPAGFSNPGGYNQVFRYTTATSAVICLSCPADGTAPTGNASLSSSSEVGRGEPIDARSMTLAGDAVFFDTPDALTPKDTNGQRDVYEWRAGERRLVSTGRSNSPSYFIDNSADGRDVFFATTEDLNGVDRDGAYDVYDARVGGGFPVPSAPAPCAGSACQGPVVGPPAPVNAATVSFVGAGNTPEAPAPTKTTVGKVSLKSRSVRGTQARLSIRTPAAGAISVSGSRLATSRRSVTKAGTYTVTVRLTARAKRQLRRARSLKASVRVRFTPEQGRSTTVNVSLTFKR